MQLNDAILGQLRLTYQFVLESLEELTEEEALRSPVGNLSPVIWQVGHLAWAENLDASRVDHAVVIPPSFEQMFRTGTGGSGNYPPLEKVTAAYVAAHEVLVEIARSGDLAKVIEGRRRSYPVSDLLLFACYHRGYHTGKIATLRGLLGKSLVFKR